MKRIIINNGKLFDYHSQNRKNNITLAITESEKQKLITGLKMNSIYITGGQAEAYSNKRECRIRKLTDGIFSVDKYEISNRKDTSRPIEKFFVQV